MSVSFYTKLDAFTLEITLVNNILDLTLLEDKIEPLELIAIRLQSWLPTISKSFEPTFLERNLDFQIDLSSDLPPLITDMNLLTRIFRELLQNACKYTPEGGIIRVAFSEAILPNRDPGLEICLCNSGVEISPEELPRIFDKFYRIPSHDPWKQGGTGLGLALVRRMVTRLNGTIEAESGQGETCFRIIFPFGLEDSGPT
jgi:signal transduction histidine kinase